jgi:hypothetical protein
MLQAWFDVLQVRLRILPTFYEYYLHDIAEDMAVQRD